MIAGEKGYKSSKIEVGDRQRIRDTNGSILIGLNTSSTFTVMMMSQISLLKCLASVVTSFYQSIMESMRR